MFIFTSATQRCRIFLVRPHAGREIFLKLHFSRKFLEILGNFSQLTSENFLKKFSRGGKFLIFEKILHLCCYIIILFRVEKRPVVINCLLTCFCPPGQKNIENQFFEKEICRGLSMRRLRI